MGARARKLQLAREPEIYRIFSDCISGLLVKIEYTRRVHGGGFEKSRPQRISMRKRKGLSGILGKRKSSVIHFITL